MRFLQRLVPILTFPLFIGAFVLLVPAGRAQAATIVGQLNTPPVTSYSGAFSIDGATFTATASGVLTDFEFYPLYNSSGDASGNFGLTITGDSGSVDCASPSGDASSFGVPYLPTFPTDASGLVLIDYTFTGTCSLISGHTYTISKTNSLSPWQVAGDQVGAIIGTLYSGSPFTDTCTSGSVGSCIDAVIPYDDPLYANPLATSSSFTFGSSGFINASDFSSGTEIVEKYQPNDFDQLASALCSIGDCYTTFTFPISASGAFSLSTTTSVQRFGQYTMITTIQSPQQLFGISIPFFYNDIVSTSTSFIVSTSTQLDVLKNTIAAAYAQAGLTNSGILSITQYCNFTSLSDLFNLSQSNNLLSCITGIISISLIPSGTQIAAFGVGLQNSFLTQFPFGYVTRVVQILNASSTQSLPALVLTIPTGYNGQGASLDLTPWNDLLGSGSMLDEASSTTLTGGQTLQQIVEPGWIDFISVLAVLAIAFGIIGLSYHPNKGSDNKSV